MCFFIYLPVYCLQFIEMYQIRYLDNNFFTCTEVLPWGIHQSICQYRLWILICVLWFVRIYYFKLVQQTSFTLLMWSKWNLINCGTMSLLSCTSIVTNLRKNYPGSSIDRSTDLQSGVVVSITAMGKWLLACLQMAISVGPTKVCHGLP